HHGPAILRMFPHDGLLFRRQSSGLFEDLIGNADLAEIVEGGSDLYLLGVLSGQAHEPGNCYRPYGETGAVHSRREIFEVEQLNKGAERGKRDIANLLFQVT